MGFHQDTSTSANSGRVWVRVDGFQDHFPHAELRVEALHLSTRTSTTRINTASRSRRSIMSVFQYCFTRTESLDRTTDSRCLPHPPRHDNTPLPRLLSPSGEVKCNAEYRCTPNSGHPEAPTPQSQLNVTPRLEPGLRAPFAEPCSPVCPGDVRATRSPKAHAIKKRGS